VSLLVTPSLHTTPLVPYTTLFRSPWSTCRGRSGSSRRRRRSRAASSWCRGSRAWASRSIRRRSSATRSAERLSGCRRLDFPPTLLVRLDRTLQIAVLRARQEAESVQRGEMLLGLRDVAQYQIGLADVLVRAAVLRIDCQGFLVDR